MKDENNTKSRIGKRRLMKCGEEAEIVEYRNAKDITARFLKTGELIRCTYNNFKIGNIKSHFTPSVYGVGIVGLEKTKVNDKQTKPYMTWQSMLQRCYDEKYHLKEPSYIGCSVCEEWLYYKNFKDWFYQNYYEIDNQQMALDKDILVKGNKIYSSDNCVFVPKSINSLFTKKDVNRGNYPIGVSWHKKSEKYQAQCNIFNTEDNKYTYKHLGCYNTPKEAFQVYKETKEENVKQVADFYKDRIPKKLYDAMMGYEVEMND